MHENMPNIPACPLWLCSSPISSSRKGIKKGKPLPRQHGPLRSPNETQLKSVEEEGQDALEVAEEAHEKEKARPEDEKEVGSSVSCNPCGGMG